MERPKPKPCSRRDRVPREKGSKMYSICSFSIPVPVSRSCKRTVSRPSACFREQCSVTVSPFAVYLNALENRFSKTRDKSSLSPFAFSVPERSDSYTNRRPRTDASSAYSRASASVKSRRFIVSPFSRHSPVSILAKSIRLMIRDSRILAFREMRRR